MGGIVLRALRPGPQGTDGRNQFRSRGPAYRPDYHQRQRENPGKWILKWAEIEPGQVLTLALLRKARQEIRDTDLFKTVTFQAERYENGELVLHIIVEERFYWLLLPRASRNADGDIKVGMRLRIYNIGGEDRTLSVLAQQEEESNGDDSEEIRMTFRMPLYSKPYDLAWGLSQIIENTTIEGFDNVETVNRASMGVSRDWNIDFLDIPLTVATTVGFSERDLDEPFPETIEAREAGRYNRLTLGLIMDDLHSERFREYGSLYAIGLTRGFEWLGSDYESNIIEFQTIRKRRLNRYDSFNYRVVFAASRDSPFDFPAFDIGGGSTVRGLESVDDRGDALLFGNFEYVFAYRKYPAVAHSLFVDVGNIYEDMHDVNLGDLHYTIGTGFRWKLESFVRTDLFLDFGYDVEAGEGKLYGGTSLPF